MKKRLWFTSLLALAPAVIAPSLLLTSCATDPTYQNITIDANNYSDIIDKTHQELGAVENKPEQAISNEAALKALIKTKMQEKTNFNASKYAYWEIVNYFCYLVKSQVENKQQLHSYYLHDFISDTDAFVKDNDTLLPIAKNQAAVIFKYDDSYFTSKEQTKPTVDKYEIKQFNIGLTDEQETEGGKTINVKKISYLSTKTLLLAKTNDSQTTEFKITNYIFQKFYFKAS
ncbi:MAG: hypothetical protein L3I91_01595 [Mycoplasma sp.]